MTARPSAAAAIDSSAASSIRRATMPVVSMPFRTALVLSVRRMTSPDAGFVPESRCL